MAPGRSKSLSRKASSRKRGLTHSLPQAIKTLPSLPFDDSPISALRLHCSRFRIKVLCPSDLLATSGDTSAALQVSHHDSTQDISIGDGLSPPSDVGTSTLFFGLETSNSQLELPELDGVAGLSSDFSGFQDSLRCSGVSTQGSPAVPFQIPSSPVLDYYSSKLPQRDDE